MKPPPRAPGNYAATLAEGLDTAELLLLPDGRILAHNLTPAVAALLAELDPADEAMRQRAASRPLPLSAPSTSVAPTVRTLARP
jgi:hypothetical protein